MNCKQRKSAAPNHRSQNAFCGALFTLLLHPCMKGELDGSVRAGLTSPLIAAASVPARRRFALSLRLLDPTTPIRARIGHYLASTF